MTPADQPATGASPAPSSGAGAGGTAAAAGGSGALPADVVELLVTGHHGDPHAVLGIHADGKGASVVRTLRPDATAATVVLGDGTTVPMDKMHPVGLFVATIDAPAGTSSRAGEAGQGSDVPSYGLEVVYGDRAFPVDDPYRFWPTLGDVDVHLIGEGRHERLWEVLGSHVRTHQGVTGTSFAVWAPSARAVRVVGDFNAWDGRLHPMRSLGSSGVWELFIPGVEPGARYKYELVTPGRGAAAQGRPAGLRGRAPARPGQHRHAVRPPVGRRRVDGAAFERRCHAGPHVGVRGPPRLVADGARGG